MRVSALLSLLFTAAAIAKPIDKASSVKVGNHTVTPEMALQILRKRATKTSTSLAAVGAPSGPNVDDGVYVSCNRPKIFSLTFDDGPSDYSWDLAKDLHAQGVRATYFINGKNWVNVETDSVNTSDGKKTYMEVIKHYVDMGHELASHTYEHVELAGLKDADIKYQMNKQSDIIYKATGLKPAIMRPPAGSYDNNDLKILRQLGYSVVTWDIDTKDWQTHDIKSEERAYESMKDDKATTLGHIALEHEVYAQTVQDFVPWAVNYVESLGYTFVTVADCLGVNAYQ